MINWEGLLRYLISFGGIFAVMAGCVNAIDYESAWYVIKLPTGLVAIVIGSRMMFRAHGEHPSFRDLTT